MKLRLLGGLLVLSVAGNLWLALVHSKQPVVAKDVNLAGLFSITNLSNPTNGEMYIIAFQDGKFWWTVNGDVLSMNAGLNQEVTLRLDRTTGRVKSTTIELINSDGKGCYFTDFNADGIPDKERVSGEEDFRVFYGGEFTPSFTDGTNRFIVLGATNLAIRFDGKKWVATGGALKNGNQ
jgi:hypothetical protein